MVEVDRPDRKARRDQGKSDPIDAYAAARAAAGGRATGIPKSRTGDVESVRAQLGGLDGAKLIRTCSRLRAARLEPPVPSIHAKRTPRPGRLVDPAAATKRAMASIAGRIVILDYEIAELDDDLHSLLTPLAPTLFALQGVGLAVAGQLLTTAGDNPDRLRHEAAFAHLCGSAPIPASSGKTTRHRLNRGGDRVANAALYRIVICRLRWDPATRAYVERRTKEGRSKAEIIRCLKRYIAREVLNAIRADLCSTAP